jgi:hypothetical protein
MLARTAERVAARISARIGADAGQKGSRAHAPARVSRLRSVSPSAVLVSPWLLGAIVAAGAALRVAQYVSDRALWADEAYLALNLLDRSALELAEPLDFNQAAPPLFLLLEKLVITTAGASEYAVRFVPLVCGIASVGVFALLARRLLHPAAAPLALLLFTAADGLIYFSSELKPYSVDVLATVALLAAGDSLLASRASATRNTILVTGILAVLVLASYAALFVVAGVVLSLILDVLWHRDRQRARRLGPVLATSAIAAAAATLLVLRQTAGVTGDRSVLDPYWVSELASAIASSLAYSPGALTTKLAAGVAAAGFIRIALADPRRGLLLGSPFAFAMIAVFLNQYPLFVRTVLFLVPLLALFLAEGVAALTLLFRGRARIVVAVSLTLLVSIAPVASAGTHLWNPRTHEELKPVLRSVAENWRSGDTLYLHWGSQYAFRYYAECECFHTSGSLRKMWPFHARRSESELGPAIVPGSPSVVLGDYEPDPLRYVAQIRPLERRGRVWVVFSHLANADEATFMKSVLPHLLKRRGTTQVRFEAPGAGAYLLDVDRRP